MTLNSHSRRLRLGCEVSVSKRKRKKKARDVVSTHEALALVPGHHTAPLYRTASVTTALTGLKNVFCTLQLSACPDPLAVLALARQRRLEDQVVLKGSLRVTAGKVESPVAKPNDLSSTPAQPGGSREETPASCPLTYELAHTPKIDRKGLARKPVFCEQHDT